MSAGTSAEMDQGLITVLLVEDNPGDARLLREILGEVESGEFELVHVDRLSTALDRLGAGGIDLVLLDLSLPDGQGIETFIEMHQKVPGVPTVVLSGISDESLAVKAVREGAQDYLVKGQVTGHLLIRSMRYAIERKRAEEEREVLIAELKDALAKIKTLRGLLPICSSCKKIRDDTGYWRQIELYVRDHSEAEFSHSICPSCFDELYPDYDGANRSQK